VRALGASIGTRIRAGLAMTLLSDIAAALVGGGVEVGDEAEMPEGTTTGSPTASRVSAGQRLREPFDFVVDEDMVAAASMSSGQWHHLVGCWT
jgi:hypothetical protein